MTEADNNPTAVTSSAPPPAPREITARARRRAWAESSVRLWWLSAIVIGLIASYFAVTQLAAALADRRLIEQGRLVDAKVIEIEGTRRITRPIARDAPRYVILTYDTPEGRAVEVKGFLQPQPQGLLQIGQTIPIRVDPADPLVWTDRTRAKAWLAEMTSVALLVPLVAVLVIVAFVRRAAVLRVWRDEPAAEAVVVAVANAATAPKSRSLRLTLKDDADKRVFTALHPVRAGVPAVGETVWVVAPQGRPGRAIVAKLYE